MSGCGPLPSVGLTQAAIRLRGVRVTAPEALRRRLRSLSTKELVAVASRFRPGGNPDGVEEATRFALRSVARRYQALSEEIAELDAQLDRLVAESAPELTSLPAIGTDHAATLLMVAGDKPQRLGSEASFASLWDVSPVEASSGKVVRHRLNRGGNRDTNRTLHLICVVRMRIDRCAVADTTTFPGIRWYPVMGVYEGSRRRWVSIARFFRTSTTSGLARAERTATLTWATATPSATGLRVGGRSAGATA